MMNSHKDKKEEDILQGVTELAILVTSSFACTYQTLLYLVFDFIKMICIQ